MSISNFNCIAVCFPIFISFCLFIYLSIHLLIYSFIACVQVAPKIKAMMMEKGSTMVGYQPMNDLPNFFRMIISNPAATHGDIDFLIEEIEKLGEEI